MKTRFLAVALPLMTFALTALSGCGGVPAVNGSAAIVGRVVSGNAAGKLATLSQVVCPEIIVTLNGSPATVTIDDDCSFLINDVQPAVSYVVEVEIVDLGIRGTVELADVGDAELIEILVQADDESITISVVRRATPEPADDLPEVIDDNNVEIFLVAGTYDTNLTVDGNNFTLVGEAGDDCDDEGWTILTGDVLVLKNNATFRNIRFEGSVTVEGNNASFINVCFEGQLVIFGHNTEVNGDDDDGDDDDDDDEDDDD